MNFIRLFSINLHHPALSRTYAVKNVGGSSGIMGLGKGKKGGLTNVGTSQKIKLPVETDPQKLIEYVCGSNIYNTGEDVKIKPDSEYPDWLWTMNVGAPIPISQLDPNTKEYWLRVRAHGIQRKNKLLKHKQFR